VKSQEHNRLREFVAEHEPVVSALSYVETLGYHRLSEIEQKFLKEFSQDNTAIVAIEELTGIRERTNSKPRNKTERRRSNSWSFFELRTFLEYKGNLHGVEVVAIPPQYTSQTCHECLWIGERSAKSFKCVNPKCRWSGDADLNASKVIAVIGAVFVNLQGIPRGLCCSLSTDSSGLLKAHTVPGTPGQCG